MDIATRAGVRAFDVRAVPLQSVAIYRVNPNGGCPAGRRYWWHTGNPARDERSIMRKRNPYNLVARQHWYADNLPDRMSAEAGHATERDALLWACAHTAAPTWANPDAASMDALVLARHAEAFIAELVAAGVVIPV
jgi:hypothetical protein